MKQYLLSLDNGGTYIKAAVFDILGNQIALVKKRSEMLLSGQSRAEYDQEKLWETNCQCIREVLEKSGVDGRQIACIGISAQGSGFYSVGYDGRSIRNAISSSDGRAKDIVERWCDEGINRQAYPSVYRDSTPGHLNAILAWLKENEPEHYRRIEYIFSMKDFLIYRLTGTAISGYGCQSCSNLMDMRTKKFSSDLSDLFEISGMEKKFGPLFWDVEPCGKISEEAARKCKVAAGTPVAAGCHDVVASAIAMGMTDSELCFVIMGTHGINGYISDQPVLNGTIKSNELFAAPGKYLIEEGYPSSSGVLEWAVSVLFADAPGSGSEIYHTINKEVSMVEPQESDLIFMPFLYGNRDNARASGTWIGLKPEHTRAHLLRAVYEGVVFTHMLQLAHLFENRDKPERLRVAGGATGSEVWMQIFADALQLPLEIVKGCEMGVKGAAIVAAVAAGIYTDLEQAVGAMVDPGQMVYPNPGLAKLYERKYRRFCQAVQALDSFWQ